MEGSIAARMGRYLKVLGLFWGAAVSAEMEYRANFLIAALTSLGQLAGNLFTLWLFYRTGHGFPGWSWEACLVVTGLFTILDGLSGTFLSANLSRIVRHVTQGTLDFVLLKPIDPQFWLSLRDVSVWSLVDVVSGAAVIAWAGHALGAGPGAYLALLPTLAMGTLLLYALWFCLGATSIWFVKVFNVTEVLRALVDAGRFPMAAYPVAYRVFFTFVVPVAFMTTVPAEAFLGRATWGWLAGAAVLTAFALWGSRAFWRFALRFYTSASS